MSLYELISSRQERISVVGLGYVGLPLAVAFADTVDVIGYDINERKIESYRNGVDLTREVGNDRLQSTNLRFTCDEMELRKCSFHIVAVPTPISADKTPDLAPVVNASRTVGRNMGNGCIVVYESTVYPGVTEDVCIPILEEESGLKCGKDFKVGYSPERINPGDKINRLKTIVKVVSGTDEEALNEIANIYELVIDRVYRAESIKVAEAAKVIENSQRDINIAFMNELSIVFDKMGIDTQAVLRAAETKWNFLKFKPGLVGGHCIGVDPYYFIYRAEQLGYHSQIILSGRRINDDMGTYVASNIIKRLIQAGKQVSGSRVAIMGITFKENCPDPRNSKVVDVINELKDYGVQISVVDPVADPEEVWAQHQIELSQLRNINDMDAVVFAVAHNEFRELTIKDIEGLYRRRTDGPLEPATRNVLIDIKGIFDKRSVERNSLLYWAL